MTDDVYRIAVIANPDGLLVEASTENNVFLRKVILKGREGKRRVVVPPVGLVVEPSD